MSGFRVFMQVETTIGAALLTASLVCQTLSVGCIGRDRSHDAVIGHLINTYGFYDYTNGVSFGREACMVEAISSCFGELALVLWQICAAITAFASMYPEWLNNATNQRRLVIGFHIFVWTTSLVTTVVPLSLGVLGFNSSTEPGLEVSYWCWFKPHNPGWEIWQFYIPLFVSATIALGTFCFLIYKIRTMDEMRASNSSAGASTERQDEQVAVFRRLAFQLFTMNVIFLPDSVSYFIQYGNAVYNSQTTVPAHMYDVTTIWWKAESWAAALVWGSNLRVREAVCKIPIVKAALVACFGESAPPPELTRARSATAISRSRKPTFSVELNVTASPPLAGDDATMSSSTTTTTTTIVSIAEEAPNADAESIGVDLATASAAGSTSVAS